ncbi:hypothetical protein CspeluHIS016_0201550 [Cutaneotrichosporon spelunceum]|uniref:Uncharacterized protein n=1 Tax=Cutaneotrichosporon spelunceum TaxID=1672016 RepID=A0AAD3TR28_9TREE|nr:hypothetical protein CspeluHIS016_0201550 [Cutaneotrichosporon spelunceum]
MASGDKLTNPAPTAAMPQLGTASPRLPSPTLPGTTNPLPIQPTIQPTTSNGTTTKANLTIPPDAAPVAPQETASSGPPAVQPPVVPGASRSSQPTLSPPPDPSGKVLTPLRVPESRESMEVDHSQSQIVQSPIPPLPAVQGKQVTPPPSVPEQPICSQGRLRKNIEKMKQLEDDTKTKVVLAKEEEQKNSKSKADAVQLQHKRDMNTLHGEVAELKAARVADATKLRDCGSEIADVSMLDQTAMSRKLRRELEEAKVADRDRAKRHETEVAAARRELEKEVAAVGREFEQAKLAKTELATTVIGLRKQLDLATEAEHTIRRLRSKAEKYALQDGLSVIAAHDNISYLRSYVTAVHNRLGTLETIKIVAEAPAPPDTRHARINGPRLSAPVWGESSRDQTTTRVKRSRPSDIEVEGPAQRRRTSTYVSNSTPRAQLEAWYRPRLYKHAPVQAGGARACAFCQLEYRSKQKKKGIFLSKDDAKVFPIVANSEDEVLDHVLAHTLATRFFHLRKMSEEP